MGGATDDVHGGIPEVVRGTFDRLDARAVEQDRPDIEERLSPGVETGSGGDTCDLVTELRLERVEGVGFWVTHVDNEVGSAGYNGARAGFDFEPADGAKCP